MKTFVERIKAATVSFCRDASGASAIEYGLVAAGIALAISLTVGNVGTSLSTMFTSIATALQ